MGLRRCEGMWFHYDPYSTRAFPVSERLKSRSCRKISIGYASPHQTSFVVRSVVGLGYKLVIALHRIVAVDLAPWSGGFAL